MSILSGWLKTRAYRKTTDGYKKESRDTSSETVFMNDGNTAETNLGDIKGITDSLTATSSNVALSAKGGNSLQGQINTLNSNLEFVLDIDYTKYLTLSDGVTANLLNIFVSGHLLKISAIITLTSQSLENISLLSIKDKYIPESTVIATASCYNSSTDEASCGIITINRSGTMILSHSRQKKYVVFNIDIPITK